MLDDHLRLHDDKQLRRLAANVDLRVKNAGFDGYDEPLYLLLTRAGEPLKPALPLYRREVLDELRMRSR